MDWLIPNYLIKANFSITESKHDVDKFYTTSFPCIPLHADESLRPMCLFGALILSAKPPLVPRGPLPAFPTAAAAVHVAVVDGGCDCAAALRESKEALRYEWGVPDIYTLYT